MRALFAVLVVGFVAACAPTNTVVVEFVTVHALAKRCYDGGLHRDCLGMIEYGSQQHRIVVSPENWEYAAELLCDGLLNPPHATKAYLGCHEVVGHELRHAVEGSFHD